MSEELMSKKSAVIFDFLDVERDGILTWKEMTTFPKYLTVTGKEQLGQDLENIYQGVWNRIHIALEKAEPSTQISREDFIRGTDIVRKSAWFRDTFVQTTTDIYFDSMDANSSGAITLDEWREFYKSRGVTDDEFIKTTFNKLDTDGDGKISRNEFKEAFAQFSVSEDPNNDYNFIYDISKVNGNMP